jgi:hypothetical protein
LVQQVEHAAAAPGGSSSAAAMEAGAGGGATQGCGGANDQTVITRVVGRNTVDYTLDAQGNTLSAKGSLFKDFGGGSRSSLEIQAAIGGGSPSCPGDQGHHIVGYWFMPEQGAINLFPQEGNFNMGAYKKLENDYAWYVARGYRVDFEHALDNFDPSSGRPAVVGVNFTVKDPGGIVLDSFAMCFENVPMKNYYRRIWS